MKKALALLLALVMVFALTATAFAEDKVDMTDEELEVALEAALADVGAQLEEAKIGVFWYAFSDAYLSTVRSELDALWEGLEIDYQNFDSNNNQGTQLEQVQTAVTNGFTVLVVNLVTSGSADAAQQIIEAANGLPVVFFNRAVEGDGEEHTVLDAYDNIAFIGTDAPEAGHMQGKMVGEFLVENYDAVDLNGDGVISYAMFMGDAANVEAIYRTQYGVEDANAVLTEAGKPELAYFDANNSDKYQLDPNGAWSSAAAFDFMSVNLAGFNEGNGNMIELVIANNDDMAIGAISALQAAGYNLGDGTSTKIPVFGVDATQVAKDAIADDTMTGTVKQDNVGMAIAIENVAIGAALGMSMEEAVNTVTFIDDSIYSVADGFTNKLFVAYAPYTGAEE